MNFDQATEQLDATTLALLGDPIVYTPVGGVPVPLTAWVNHSDSQQGSGTRLTVPGVSLELSHADVPVRPGPGCIVHLPLTGRDYEPRQVDLDESGRYWIVALKVKP